MDVCVIDEDFTLDVVEDPEVQCDDEYLRNLLEKVENKSTNRISASGEELRPKTIVKGVFEKVDIGNGKTVIVEAAAEKVMESREENQDLIDKNCEPSSSCKYKCHACGYYTSTLTCYCIHIREHFDPTNKLLRCKKCHFSTFTKGSLTQHMNNRHVPKEKWIKCPHCDFATIKHKNLTVHLNKIHLDGKKKQIKCFHCEFVTESKKDLDKHKQESHNRKLRCRLCGFWSSTKEEKKKHMKEHGSKSKPKNRGKNIIHKCDFCDYVSIYFSNVVRHQTKHVTKLVME